MSPGVTHIPFASTTSIPSGTLHAPAQSILPSRMTIVAFGTGAPPRPSMSVAPTIARGGAGVPGGVSTAPVTAIFQPSGVFTKSRSEMPLCSSDP